MKTDNRGRTQEQRRTLATRGTEGISVSETAETVSIAMDIASMTEETVVDATDYMLTYSDDLEEHTRVPIADFLNFPPRGCAFKVYSVDPENPTKSLFKFTKLSGVQFFMAILVGGGAGGGSGPQGQFTSPQLSGAGGGGGAYQRTPLIPAQFFQDGSLRVGTGGNGAVGAIGVNVAGSAAGSGTQSTMSGLIGGVEITASGGSAASAAPVNSSSAVSGGAGASNSTDDEGLSNGGNGGSSNDSSAGTPPQTTIRGAAGGGGGGGRTASAASTFLGHAGGRSRMLTTTLLGGTTPAAYGSGADAENGGDGMDAYPLLSGAPGGGGGVFNVSADYIGGSGGNGGFPGGGGGGGGSGVNGNAYSGSGGDGGHGLVAVFQFY